MMVPKATRARAALHLIDPEQLQESLAIAEPPSLRNSAVAGLQAGLTCLLVLPATYLSPWSHLTGFVALGAMAALFGRFVSRAERRGVVLMSALCLASGVLVISAFAMLGAPGPLMLLALAAMSALFLFIVSSLRLGPPGALIFIFAAGGSMSGPGAWHGVLEQTMATALAGGLAWVVTVVTDHWRESASQSRPFPIEAASPLKDRLFACGRIFVGTLAAALVAYAAGLLHPAWAVLGAAAVLQSVHLHLSMNRALQRMAGTVVGACLAWALLAQDPSVWWVIGSLVVCQLLTEIIIGYNYGVGQVLVTPMALLMNHLAAPGVPTAGLAPERVIDTILGASIGMVLAVVYSRLGDRLHYARHRQARRARRP